MFYTPIPDVAKIHQDFLLYLSNHKNFTTINTKTLDSNSLIELAIELENFLLKKKDIHIEIVYNESIVLTKRDFVQRVVFLEYKHKLVPEIWENEYCFTNEEKFAKDCINPNEQLIKYTAFALFTERGKRKHENHTVFNLPKSITEKDDFLSVNNYTIKARKQKTRTGFNLTDTFPSKNSIDWHLSYCLYCHKRNKDSCSKGLNEAKSGCPLKQDISESIFLKRHNKHIAALAVVMRQNPLCILTGRRICNNCEEACIFQKQEAVDVQSVETQILNDILNMPYGLEIYNLLLLWNPLSMKNECSLTGKTIMVAGLGPAGLFACHEFSKLGAKVIGIDALNIEISPKIKYIAKYTIKDITPLLNESLEERKPSNIGGVMEYGITVRWNKNYLDLLIGLLLRREGIKFIGSTRIGGLLNYNDIFNYFKFNHLALCVGSAKPKLPFYIENLFTGYSLTNGIIMASDFLMSLHINRESKYLDSFVKSPVYILGCGLTAIDTACEIRALLLKNNIQSPIVKVLYYQGHKNSSAYKINHLEFKKALEEGIEIIENINIIKIKRQDNRISSMLTKDGGEIFCQTLIIAIGTEPNTDHILEFTNKNNVSFFGDCNPQYTGSVVNALASVQNGIGFYISQTANNSNTAINLEELYQEPVVDIGNISNNLYKINITSPLVAKKTRPGNVLKFQIMYENSLALTVACVQNNEIILYLHNTNCDTQNLIDAIQNGIKIHINGVNCNSFPEIPENTIIIASQKAETVLKNIFQNHKILLPEEFLNSSHNNSEYFVAIEDECLRNTILDNIRGKARVFIYNKMNCMLGGICGRCIKPSGEYSCQNNIIELIDDFKE
jgi:NADPH-dependent glutamate synthase beta subunit-like oxidoreductase